MSITRWAPGLASFRHYGRDDLGADLRAGLAVAAVAIPVGIAYAELAGFPPQAGLYSSLLPLILYFLFGSSRQLILGPDAATCAVIAASVAPLAAGNPDTYLALSGMMAVMTGLICIGASFLRLGALADFLSKPILVGFLNGIAITIIVGQLGKMLGISLDSDSVLGMLAELSQHLGDTHIPTAAIAFCAFAAIHVSGHYLPSLPAAVSAMVVSGLAVFAFNLDDLGVRILGEVPAGLPALALPHFDIDRVPDLFGSAAGLALVSFSSLMLTSRSFASKNRYMVDADRDFAALGMANVASAMTQGFAVAGADSRTAMADAAGGRTRATGLFAAAAVAVMLLLFTQPLAYVPIAALGAVLVFAGLSLLDWQTLRLIYRVDRVEALISVCATVGVIAYGATEGIMVAVGLAVLRFVHISARPKVETLGRIDGVPGFHSLARHRNASPLPGLLIVRFNGPVVFFNASHFRHSLMQLVEQLPMPPRVIILDLLPVTDIDVTGLFTLKDVKDLLNEKGIELVGGGRQTEWHHWARKRHIDTSGFRIYRTVHQAAIELALHDHPATQHPDDARQATDA